MMYHAGSPRIRAAATKSRLPISRVRPRTMRITPGAPATVMAMTILTPEAPTVAITMM